MEGKSKRPSLRSPTLWTNVSETTSYPFSYFSKNRLRSLSLIRISLGFCLSSASCKSIVFLSPLPPSPPMQFARCGKRRRRGIHTHSRFPHHPKGGCIYSSSFSPLAKWSGKVPMYKTHQCDDRRRYGIRLLVLLLKPTFSLFSFPHLLKDQYLRNIVKSSHPSDRVHVCHVRIPPSLPFH